MFFVLFCFVLFCFDSLNSMYDNIGIIGRLYIKNSGVTMYWKKKKKHADPITRLKWVVWKYLLFIFPILFKYSKLSMRHDDRQRQLQYCKHDKKVYIPVFVLFLCDLLCFLFVLFSEPSSQNNCRMRNMIFFLYLNICQTMYI